MAAVGSQHDWLRRPALLLPLHCPSIYSAPPQNDLQSLLVSFYPDSNKPPLTHVWQVQILQLVCCSLTWLTGLIVGGVSRVSRKNPANHCKLDLLHGDTGYPICSYHGSHCASGCQLCDWRRGSTLKHRSSLVTSCRHLPVLLLGVPTCFPS